MPADEGNRLGGLHWSYCRTRDVNFAVSPFLKGLLGKLTRALTPLAILRWRHSSPALESAREVTGVVEAKQKSDFSYRARRLLHVRATEFFACVIEQLLEICAVLEQFEMQCARAHTERTRHLIPVTLAIG